MESRRNGPQLSSRHDDDDDGANKRQNYFEFTLIADTETRLLGY